MNLTNSTRFLPKKHSFSIFSKHGYFWFSKFFHQKESLVQWFIWKKNWRYSKPRFLRNYHQRWNRLNRLNSTSYRVQESRMIGMVEFNKKMHGWNGWIQPISMLFMILHGILKSWYNLKNSKLLGTCMGTNYPHSWLDSSKNPKILLGKDFSIEFWSFLLKMGGCCNDDFWPIILSLLPFLNK